METLNETDLKILVALGENPLGSISWLSKRVGIAPSTLSKRLSRLVDMRIFERPGYVSAQVCYSSVGLELAAVFIQASPEHWALMEKACDLHPYTRYRIRCMGAVNGFFVMFAVPRGTVSLLLQFLDALARKGVITNYHLQTPINKWAYTEADFRLHDAKTGLWRFDWDEWEARMDVEEPSPLRLYPPSVLEKMDEVDMLILRRLSIDARMERRLIAKAVGVRPYQLSRRLKFYEENQVIDSYRIVFGPVILGMLTVALFEGKCPVDVTEKIAFAVSELPFQTTFVPTQSGFILYSVIPATGFPNLAAALQRRCASVNVMWGDYTTSMRYWFDNEVSNFREGAWVVDRDFMVVNVIDGLKLGV
ncbi:MAG: Lrp/AsnC family transcriptional regulator [Candidatus Bathyarchaeia archaeon]